MNNANLQMADTHLAWQQRLIKEKGNYQRYVERGYRGGFDHQKGPWLAKHPENNDSEEEQSFLDKHMKPTYPVPHKRLNQDHRARKMM